MIDPVVEAPTEGDEDEFDPVADAHEVADWADEPSDAFCGCGARAVGVWPMMGGLVLACSASGMGCDRCPDAVGGSGNTNQEDDDK